MPEWITYMLRCGDGSLYTGITTDLDRRIHEHNHTRQGAAYTRARRPVALVYREKCATRSAATRREYELRRLPRAEKERLID